MDVGGARRALGRGRAVARRLVRDAEYLARRGLAFAGQADGLVSVLLRVDPSDKRRLGQAVDGWLKQDYRLLEVVLIPADPPSSTGVALDADPDSGRAAAPGEAGGDVTGGNLAALALRDAARGRARVRVASAGEALAAAKGEFVIVAHADETVRPDAVSILVRALRQSGSAFASASFGWLQAAKKLPAGPAVRGAHSLGRRHAQIDDFPQALANQELWTRLFRRSFVDSARLRLLGGRHDGRLVVARAHALASGFDVLPDVLFHRPRSASLTPVANAVGDAADLRGRAESGLASLGELRQAGRLKAAEARLTQLARDDIGPAVRGLPGAEDAYWDVLLDYWRQVADAVQWERVPSHVAGSLWLLSLGDRGLVERYLAEGGQSPQLLECAVVGGRPAIKIPFFDDPSVAYPPEVVQQSDDQLELECRLVKTARLGQALELSGFAYLTGVDPLAHPFQTRVSLVGDGWRKELPVEAIGIDPVDVRSKHPFNDYTQCGWRVLVGTDDVPGQGRWQLEVEASALGVSRSRRLDDFTRLGGNANPPVVWVGAGIGLTVELPKNGPVAVVLGPAAASKPGELTVTHFSADDEGLTLGGVGAKAGDAAVALADDRHWLSAPLVWDGLAWQASLPLRIDQPLRGAHPLPVGRYRIVFEGLAAPKAGWPTGIVGGTQVDDPTAGPASASVKPETPFRQAPLDRFQPAAPAGRAIAADLANELANALPVRRQSADCRVELTRDKQGLLLILRSPAPDNPVEQHRLQQRYAASTAPLVDAVVFRAYGGEKCTDSGLAVHQELLARGWDGPLYWAVKDHSVPVPAGGTPVLVGSPRWYDVLATSRYIVDNWYQPKYFAKRQGQVFVQTLHGYPFKSAGFSKWRREGRNKVLLERRLRQFGEWDFLVSPALYATPLLQETFPSGAEILEIGYPRNDIFFSDAAADLRNRVRSYFGIDDGNTTLILYAPTFRDELMVSAGYSAQLDDFGLDDAIQSLPENSLLLLRGHAFHSRLGERRQLGSRVVNVTDYPEITELCLASDAAVLDYSSLRFDYAQTGKPMVFLVPDLANYVGEMRGALIPYEPTAPGPLVNTWPEAFAQLSDLGRLRADYADARARFRRDYTPLEDGRAAARLVERVFGSGPFPA
ncbi:MAG: CDP-glycerol glycerophosphotransferase family protein [Propionibacteriaceae bacterium]|jgi:CDP-glycerol glycerophosphotransferase (TagB/SpsB family)|nr:CDP-glycerol glycerophosphotransferase family protein [Propionibacteriaceae bacterium]